MNVEVIIEKIGQTQTYGSNGFRKREVVAMTNEDQYAQPLVFEFVQDKCDLLDNFAEGQIVDIHFNLRGNRWQPQGKPEKIFVSLQGWKIESQGQATEPRANSAVNQYENTQDNGGSIPDDEDLPFAPIP